jgi:tripartite-type tricarboxylate transporter receptor subunit TctC
MSRQRFLVVLLMSGLLLVADAYGQQQKYPTRNITGIVQWGAGGGTDSLMRPLSALVRKELGVSVIVQNKAGGTGSIATQFVYDAQADGYTLLMGAENPTLYKALDISKLTYDDFEPVFLIGQDTVGIVVSKSSKYTSFKQLIQDALARPGTIKISTTGKGGLPWTVGAYITSLTKAKFNQIPYDSDIAALTAVKGGECDFTICKVQSGITSYKAGDIKYLTMLAIKPVSQMPEVPLIITDYPDFKQFLPWGPFYGIFVKKGTSQDIVKKLGSAFNKGFDESSYQTVLKNFNVEPLGLTGEKAADYLKNWQKNTLTALVNSGAIDKTLEKLGYGKGSADANSHPAGI